MDVLLVDPATAPTDLSDSTFWTGHPRCQGVDKPGGRRCKLPARPESLFCGLHGNRRAPRPRVGMEQEKELRRRIRESSRELDRLTCSIRTDPQTLADRLRDELTRYEDALLEEAAFRRRRKSRGE